MNPKTHIASMEAYVPGRSIPGAVKLSSNENPLGPSPKAMQAIQKALNGINRYPDGASTALGEALAALWRLEPENCIVANGSDEIFLLLCAAWLSSDENAISARQTFSQYRYAVKLFGAEMREADLLEGQYNLDAMAKMVDKKTRIIFICNPNNPTGTYKSAVEIERFLEQISDQIIVVIDEAYADFADAPDFPDSRILLSRYPNLIVSRTFSKLWGLAGIRIGYGLGDSRLISTMKQAAMPFSVNILAQTAALAAIKDENHRRMYLELVRSEKVFLSDEFRKRSIRHYPSQANFLCVELKQNVAELWQPIAEKGIAIRDLSSFGLPKMFRYTYGTRENNLNFLSILDELI